MEAEDKALTPVFEDIHLNCVECGAPFVFTVGEQQFFSDKGLKNPPKRCKPCKTRKNERFNQLLSMMATDGSRPRIQVEVECAECGIQTTVPFLPTQGRPVLCRDCFVRAQVTAQVTTPACTKPTVKYVPPTAA
ncbi:MULTISPECIES: zinc-ribbon domain containing protein [Chloracidobacterium]|jgi:CxxC-x17-CxxC domain-containing protein|uniref:Zinc-ribbon domain containing protein n=1 Tax=Chloracidobacterium sp. N TaxID=2821540 RepID=A0ABX8B278_9BACT|nr:MULTISPECIES: zinc-ribbon domain containing protein [Chloracidobacterium]QUV83942.1 zinc-ribbon domain containing protein [Chloracidobacterium sp. 2]QUV87575.1 zinc-ribbon domain containing protein [Chloracidobacterium sp. S]QUV93686.1 zinc-ribbon domain containing protein [Chloracidobacterium sp. N]QUV96841.1 zinc-ribbon domain containing protein [Chloracidobacterium sp. E]